MTPSVVRRVLRVSVPFALGAVVLTLVAACQHPRSERDGTASRSGTPRQVAGCWDLQPAGEGAERETVRRWIEEGALPDVLELDTARAEAGGEGDTLFVAWSHVHSRRQRRPLAAWRPVPGDSLRVETPGALAGTALRLAAESGRLAGTATVFTDVIEPGREEGRRSAPVEGRATGCPR